jgi:hypothetical protein
MKLDQMAQQVADDIVDAEDAIDIALNKAAKLTGSMTEARLNGKISAVMGQDAFDGLGIALSSLMTARDGMVRTHNGLAVVRDRIGVRIKGEGGVLKPTQSRLRTVA